MEQGEVPRSAEQTTHPCLVNGVVKFGFHGDLAVGVRVHQGQPQVGVVATSGAETIGG